MFRFLASAFVLVAIIAGWVWTGGEAPHFQIGQKANSTSTPLNSDPDADALRKSLGSK